MNWQRLFALGALLLSLAGQPGLAKQAPRVVTTGGTVEGQVRTSGVMAFTGIPYAAPPVGANRWAPPRAARPWRGVRPAMADVPACAQPDMGWNSDSARNGSENCLFVDVFTPSTSGKRPVMVWFHGGGFTGGAGSSKTFDGVRLAREGVVLVTVNYRLGVFGFMTGIEGLPANLGLQDQVAALRWVRANAARFGGDPARVTIFGQSAGGFSVMAHLSSPAAQGLFSQAIVESGASATPLAMGGADAAAKEARKFLDGHPLAWWRNQPTSALLARYSELVKQSAGRPYLFMPVPDGRTVALPGEEKPASVPLMIGSNSQEGFNPVAADKLPGAIARAFGKNAEKAKAFYSGGDDPVFGSAETRLATDTSFRCGAVLTAQRQAAADRPVWVYLFEQPLPGQQAKGAHHSDELQFVFGNFTSPPFKGGVPSADRALSNVMMGYWTRFAKTGNPNGGASPHWLEFTAPDGPYMRFATAFPGDASAASNLRGGVCGLLEGADR